MDYTVDIEPLLIGRLGKTYGVFGWLRVFSFTDRFDAILSYQPWIIKVASRWIHIYLEDSKQYCAGCFIVKIQTIHSRESAKLLSNSKIFINVSQLPVLNDGEFYWKDLIGCQVFEQCYGRLGVVVNLIETGSNDVLVVENVVDRINCTYLIPFIEKQVIQNINLVARVINVHWKLYY